MGIEVEDSFCSILMKRAPVVNSIEELRIWAESLIEDHAKAALENGRAVFEGSMWSRGISMNHLIWS